MVLRLPSSALVALVVALAAPGCNNDKPASKQTTPAAPCARIGQTCEVSAGKLGTCVAPEGCEDAKCLVCQSQH